MTVFIITRYTHVGSDIIGVFGSKELAARKMNEFKLDDDHLMVDYSVSEHEVENE